MINNTIIELDTDSKARNDAENIIKYTYLLDYKIPEISAEDPNYLFEICQATQNCCFSLFSKNPKYIQYNFFGDYISTGKENLLYLHLTSRQNNSTPYSLQTESIEAMLLQNSIMSCYHAILTCLSTSANISSYQINNLEGAGFHKAYKKNSLSILNDEICFQKSKLINKSKSSRTKTKNASNFNKLLTSKKNRFPEQFSFLMDSNDSSIKYTRYPLPYASLCSALCKVSLPDLKQLWSSSSKTTTIENTFDSLDSIIKILMPLKRRTPYSKSTDNWDFSPFNNDIVDGVYHYYLTEKAYNFHLYYCLLENIKNVSQHTSYRFTEQEIISILTLCTNLPNPFSRAYFLKYAFDHIEAKTNSYHDFWLYHDMNQRHIVGLQNPKTPKGFQFQKWLQQYELFINYISKHVIPIYDWCFLTMFLHGIENTYPKQSHSFHLVCAFNLLSNYIEKNYKAILHPIPLITNSTQKSKPSPSLLLEKSSILTSKNFITLLDTFEEEQLLFLHKEFFKNRDFDLNIQPLAIPTQIRSSQEESELIQKDVMYDDIKYVQDFYINMLFNI